MVNLVTYVLYRLLTVICFLDVSLVWIDATRLSSETRYDRKARLARWRRNLKRFEFVVFLVLLTQTIALVASSGQSYNVGDAVLVLLLSLIIAVAFAYGRFKLRLVLLSTKSTMNGKKGAKTGQYLKIITRTSFLVIAANVGIIITQLFSVISIRSFEDLVLANNDPVTSSLIMLGSV